MEQKIECYSALKNFLNGLALGSILGCEGNDESQKSIGASCQAAGMTIEEMQEIYLSAKEELQQQQKNIEQQRELMRILAYTTRTWNTLPEEYQKFMYSMTPGLSEENRQTLFSEGWERSKKDAQVILTYAGQSK